MLSKWAHRFLELNSFFSILWVQNKKCLISIQSIPGYINYDLVVNFLRDCPFFSDSHVDAYTGIIRYTLKEAQQFNISK